MSSVKSIVINLTRDNKISPRKEGVIKGWASFITFGGPLKNYEKKITSTIITRVNKSRTLIQVKGLYEINSYRLPSVTTILGATKNQEFLKEWKAKVGEKEAERIKNVSSSRGTSMHKFLESFITDVWL